jgi:hypothetical protein
MDHFQLGRAAFEARQFAEADTQFKRAESALAPEELTALRKFQYQCAKILRPESCWREFYVFALLYADEYSPDEVLKFLEAEMEIIPSLQKGILFELQSSAYFKKGALTQSREFATRHVEHLLAKKLSTHLLTSAKRYEKWFPQSVYFQFIHLQALLALENVVSASKQFHAICKTVQRKWAKIEDKNENSKTSLLLAMAESVRALDGLNGEATILFHKALLQSYLVSDKKLAKEDWKKVAELVVHEDSWGNLKLALELAILNGEKPVALAAYSALKRKRGFSFVKLTKYDASFKEWLLTHAGVRPLQTTESESVEPISAEDLKLGDSSPPAQGALWENEVNEEIRAVELNAIKQLELHGPGVELLPDLLVAYRTMGFHRVVSWLLQRYSLGDMRPELKRKIQYFKVIHALDMSEGYLGLAFVEEMLGDEQLTMDEYKELKYAQGCLFMSLKRHSEARQSFMAVTKVDPAYRQTRERMGLLAQD